MEKRSWHNDNDMDIPDLISVKTIFVSSFNCSLVGFFKALIPLSVTGDFRSQY